MTERRIGVFHPGTQHSWQTALAFQEAGRLAWYATSVFYDAERWPYRVERYLPRRLAALAGREFRRRWTPALDVGLVRQFGLHEWLETAARRFKLHRLAHVANVRGNRALARHVIALMEREPVDAVIGYGNASVEVFRWAKSRGLTCILDQPTIHPRAQNAITAAEQALHPEFFLERSQPFDDAWIDQQDEELALADKVLVGSRFCAETLLANGCAADKIEVVNYGYDGTLFPGERPVRRGEGPVRFLYVGRIDARKGAAHLLKAFAAVPPDRASLTMVGKLDIPATAFAPFAQRVTLAGQLPRAEVVKHFLDAECFVFPSLFEGGGIVLYEALAAGLGIIQTPAAAVAVEDGRNGLILDRICEESLMRAIEFAAESRGRLREWQSESWRMRQKHGWDVYREHLRKLIP